MKKTDFVKGLKAGIPIGLGYLSVAIAFGIMGSKLGLHIWQTLLISMLTLTSAGQLAGLNIMINPGLYLEMLITQSTINIRYSFMSISLSQKIDSKFKGIYKWLLGFFITDEIFAVAISKEKVSRSFFFGLGVLPYIGWASGTLIGAIIGSVLPIFVMNALSIALYGMFVAIIVPVIKNNKETFLIVLISIILSVLFYYLPILKEVSSGIAISVCAVLSAILGAILFPKKEDESNES
jgi:predicted branched-subunit amino acid permease